MSAQSLRIRSEDHAECSPIQSIANILWGVKPPLPQSKGAQSYPGYMVPTPLTCMSYVITAETTQLQ